MRVLGINAVFHDPAAALVVDGRIVAAAEEERFSRRKHGKRPVPFAAWELPEQAARWCLREGGITAADIDAVGYSYDPALVDHTAGGLDPAWEKLRTLYARRAPRFLATALPGLDPAKVRFVRHHVAHAASAGLAAPFGDCAVLVSDGRGESTSMLAGEYRGGKLIEHATQRLPHSLGLTYEDLTEHLGFRRSSDEYKVMALASYGTPRFLPDLREHIRSTGDGGFHAEPPVWSTFAPARAPDHPMLPEHADLAASVQRRLEEVLLELAGWLHRQTGQRRLALAGGTALNCVANTRLFAEGPFEDVWVQPAAGDAGTALGAALHLSGELDGPPRPMAGADLGRGWSDAEIEHRLTRAELPFQRSEDVAADAARALADDKIVAWFVGRSEFGPRALGHRSLLAHPGRRENLDRLNDIKGREKFRPVAPMVLADRAAELFGRGPVPSAYMLFVHDVAPDWRDRIPAVTHVDGTARVQTVDAATEPLLAHLLTEFEHRCGLPVVVNTSLNTAGRPMVDDPVGRAGTVRRVSGRPARDRAVHGVAPRLPETAMTPAYTVVVPTVGRDSLRALLHALDRAPGPPPTDVVVVDDRPAGAPLVLPETDLRVTVLLSGGGGPAAARNVGWRRAATEWIAFLDDDVLVTDDWRRQLVADLAGLGPDVGASQARIVVPEPPAGRRPTDDERATIGLAGARWITADMAYRRSALAAVGGFDERFPRAYREDTDLALRVQRAGWLIVTGERVTTHPLRRGGFFSSVRVQAGNADDALLRHKFGAGWRRCSGAGRGRLPAHLATTAAAATAVIVATRRPDPGRSPPQPPSCG